MTILVFYGVKSWRKMHVNVKTVDGTFTDT